MGTLGHGELSPTTFEDLMVTVGNLYQIRNQNWFSQKKDYDDERDPQAVFNALDTMLKDSLECLRMIRESILMAGTLWECSSETDFTGYVAIIRALCVEGKSGIRPNRITCNILVHALCKKGLLEEAKKLLREKLDDDCDRASSDLITSTTLIDGYCKNEDLVQALELWDEMCQKGAVCSFGHIRVALQLHDEMLRRGYEPDIITYTELIQGHFMNGNMKEAEELFVKIQKSGLSIDHVPFQILIKKYFKMKQPDRAFDLYKKMVEKGHMSHPSTSYALISELRKKGHIQEAIQVCRHVDALGLME
ncbi:hypothetical protein HHK36_025354 [Tetracentron sinense]|uniref:Pentatricopeptide repeat-containing protein n=1 Tax=Tetracentron sinense TaxID=13715 RepID=A0A834YHE4_TETSI|nr:hypothetical protein HHK36_025354 [Tetracentron sinense]